VSQEPATGRAYLIAIGVNAYQSPEWDLKFVANDARRMQAVVGRRLQGYGVIPISLISDYAPNSKRLKVNQATKANIRKTLNLLAGQSVDARERHRLSKRVRTATPDDLVLLFLAGHGYTDEAGTFFFFPHDRGKRRRPGELTAELLAQAISTTELSFWLRQVDAGTVAIIIDACHSEGAVEPPGFKLGPFGSRGLGQLAFDKGMQVLAASQTEGVALESAMIEQGLLTYALVHDGLEAGWAAENGLITLSAWLEYGADRVPELYEEICSDELRHLMPYNLQDIRQKEFVQRPALFDFTRRKGRIFLAAGSNDTGAPSRRRSVPQR
jgi:uncharacterized caspase-like protein